MIQLAQGDLASQRVLDVLHASHALYARTRFSGRIFGRGIITVRKRRENRKSYDSMLVCSHLPGETTRYILADKDGLPPLLGFQGSPPPEVNPYLVAFGKSVALENQPA